MPQPQARTTHLPLLAADLFRKVLAVGASFSRFNMVRPDGTLVTASNNTGGDVARYNPDGSLRQVPSAPQATETSRPQQ